MIGDVAVLLEPEYDKVIYSPELGARICNMLAGGKTLTAICKLRSEGMPQFHTIYHWLREYPDFEKGYILARQAYVESLVDEMVGIADNSDDPQKARVQIDTRKWIAGKVLSTKYGDRNALEITGAGGGPLQLEVGTSEQRRAALEMAMTMLPNINAASEVKLIKG